MKVGDYFEYDGVTLKVERVFYEGAWATSILAENLTDPERAKYWGFELDYDDPIDVFRVH